MTSETDEQFLDGMEWAYGHHMTPESRDRLFALARKGAADAGWRPIETAPRDGTEVLITNGAMFSARFDYGCWDVSGGQVYNATHWMPLPPPPQETKP